MWSFTLRCTGYVAVILIRSWIHSGFVCQVFAFPVKSTLCTHIYTHTHIQDSQMHIQLTTTQRWSPSLKPSLFQASTCTHSPNHSWLNQWFSQAFLFTRPLTREKICACSGITATKIPQLIGTFKFCKHLKIMKTYSCCLRYTNYIIIHVK